MIKRILSEKIAVLSKKFPVIAILGPRQSGKTTLAQSLFSAYEYRNLEEPDTRLFAANDPRAFLAGFENGLIIDEVQRVPDLFSYIQTFVDKNKIPGKIVLTGSHHFLLHEKISQTLAGRVGIVSLLPFSIEEIYPHKKFSDYYDYIFSGFYPPIYDRDISPVDWYSNYLQTYIEKDIRTLKNISDLNVFNHFLRMCAGRIGQLLNLSSFANELGVSVNTVKSYLSVLEASFVLFQLHPYYTNTAKRLVKTSKIYFYDTGLVSHLLGIKNSHQIQSHYNAGGLFENFVVAEIMKYYFNRGIKPEISFFRDKLGREVDCIVEDGKQTIPIEIKSGKTVSDEFFKGLYYWKEFAKVKRDKGILVYGGDIIQKRTGIDIYPWFKIKEILDEQDNKRN